jgi:glycosyltransferase involved in cell wall biosynthesis
MKILHIIPSVNQIYGGPVQSAKNLSESFSERLQQTAHVATCDPPSASYLKSFSSHISVIPLGPKLLKYSISFNLLSWLSHNSQNYDCIIVHGIWQFHSLAVWLATRKTRTPYFLFTHGMLDPWFRRKHPLKHIKKWIYWTLFEHHVVRDACAVFFTSDTEKELAPLSFKNYQANSVTIPYGIEKIPEDSESQILAWEQAHPELVNKRYFLFLGRVDPKKSVDLTIIAFCNVAKIHPDIHLVIAGPVKPTYQKKIKKLYQTEPDYIRSRIHWVPFISGFEKSGAMRCAEAFVLHSHQENFGLAIAEALSCGTPVLISKSVNIYQDIIDFRAGIVDDDTIYGAESTMIQWLQINAIERKRFKENAKILFDQKYDIKKNARLILNIMLNHLNS